MKCPHCEFEVIGIEDVCGRCGSVVLIAPHKNATRVERATLEYSVVQKKIEEEWANAARRATSSVRRPPPPQKIVILGAVAAALVVCALIALVFG